MLAFGAGFVWVYWIDVLIVITVILLPIGYLILLIARTMYLLFRGDRDMGSLDMLELLAGAALLASPVCLLLIGFVLNCGMRIIS